jgi:hypothetical protein
VTYSEKLKDPRWQRKRLEILEAAGWKCEACNSNNVPLHVHHKFYQRGLAPWEYRAGALVSLCSSCHEEIEELSRLFLSTLHGKDFPALIDLSRLVSWLHENKFDLDDLCTAVRRQVVWPKHFTKK